MPLPTFPERMLLGTCSRPEELPAWQKRRPSSLPVLTDRWSQVRKSVGGAAAGHRPRELKPRTPSTVRETPLADLLFGRIFFPCDKWVEAPRLPLTSSCSE